MYALLAYNKKCDRPDRYASAATASERVSLGSGIPTAIAALRLRFSIEMKITSPCCKAKSNTADWQYYCAV